MPGAWVRAGFAPDSPQQCPLSQLALWAVFSTIRHKWWPMPSPLRAVQRSNQWQRYSCFVNVKTEVILSQTFLTYQQVKFCSFLQGLGKKSVEPRFLFRFASTALSFQTEEYFLILISSPGLECLLVIPLNPFQFSVALYQTVHTHTHVSMLMVQSIRSSSIYNCPRTTPCFLAVISYIRQHISQTPARNSLNDPELQAWSPVTCFV